MARQAERQRATAAEAAAEAVRRRGRVAGEHNEVRRVVLFCDSFEDAGAATWLWLSGVAVAVRGLLIVLL